MAAPDGIERACREAKKVRRKWKMGRYPARQLTDMCEGNDILVFRTSALGSLSGAFVRSRRQNVILVNTAGKNAHHQRFTLAHELGHLFLHRDCAGMVEELSDDGVGAREREAHTFAAALLVDLDVLRAELKHLRVSPAEVSDPLVVQLSDRFGISHHVLLRRLRALSGKPYEWCTARIESGDWSRLWKVYAPEGQRDTVPESATVHWRPEGVPEKLAAEISELPDVYRDMAFEAYQSGLITSARLAEILEVDKGDVIAFIEPLLKPEAAVRRQRADDLLNEALGKD